MSGVKKKVVKKAKTAKFKPMLPWLKGIRNNIYWCAVSSKGNGDLCRAKYRAITNHISGVHQHTDPLFPKCEHEDNLERDYLKPGEY